MVHPFRLQFLEASYRGWIEAGATQFELQVGANVRDDPNFDTLAAEFLHDCGRRQVVEIAMFYTIFS